METQANRKPGCHPEGGAGFASCFAVGPWGGPCAEGSHNVTKDFIVLKAITEPAFEFAVNIKYLYIKQ
jgi:hypothetical protein